MTITTPNLLALPNLHPNSTTPDHQSHHRCLFSALESAATISHLKQIHTHVVKSGNPSDPLLIKLVISSCSFSSSGLDYALSVFDQISNPGTRVSNRLLREFSRSFEPEKTLLVNEKMRRNGVAVDRFSFPPVLKAVARLSCGIVDGREIHGLVLKMGFGLDPFVQTGLVRMYGCYGRISEARLVFDRMSIRDVVAWSVMIDSCCKSGLYDDVFLLYEEMKSSNLEPDGMTLCSLLSACGRAGNLSIGKLIHKFINDKSITVDKHLQTALVTMYTSCGCMDLAQQVLDNVSQKNIVASTAMVSGYSKLGQVEAARLIFDNMLEKDLICWSAMIAGYAESDKPQEALKLFDEMRAVGIKPDQVTILSVISACAHLGVLDQANLIHNFVSDSGLGEALSLNNAFIDMFAKCGDLEKATIVFNRMPRKNVISWTSMINAFAIHGDASHALRFFEKMMDENVEPNGVTFVGVLFACSHAGLVDEGRKLFASMINEHKITPKHEHYGCMVDLFGRANLLREALEFIEAMPLPPNIVIWGALMAACQVHGDTELGEFAAKRVLDMDPNHDGAHVVLSNIYAKKKRWGDVLEVRNFMKHKGLAKERGYSRIELGNEIYEFLTADRKHQQTNDIYNKLDQVVHEVKCAGYTPNTSNVLINLEEEQKEDAVLWHSEKLALCLGLISERKGSSCIRIVKNLRVCEDCHTFMKFVSKVYDRDIVIRDRTRFHHYKDGVCSCKDYW